MSECFWPLTDEDYEFIKGEVTHILLKYNVKCIPVSGFEIASKMGITLIPYFSLYGRKLQTAYETSKDGYFVEDNGHEYIYYNDIDWNYERQNWTVLHEIGHIVLDHTGHSKREEKEADFFAKFAIAPPVLVYKIKAKGTVDIYNAFNITYEAASYAFSYYQKWLRKHLKEKDFKDYEKQLIWLYENNKTIQTA